MITVHHLENSRSQRILWLLEELGLTYELQKYARDPVTKLAPMELLKLHPLGKAPIVADGDDILAESGAIIEYLIRKYDKGHLRPEAGTPAGMAYTFWLHYAEGSFMPFMVLSLIVNRIETAPMPFFVKPIAKSIAAKVRADYLDFNVKRNLDFMESTLDNSRWFCGDDFSAADVQMGFALEAASVRTDLDNKYVNLSGFMRRMRDRPAYQRAVEKGGPYDLLGANTKK